LDASVSIAPKQIGEAFCPRPHHHFRRLGVQKVEAFVDFGIKRLFAIPVFGADHDLIGGDGKAHGPLFAELSIRDLDLPR